MVVFPTRTDFLTRGAILANAINFIPNATFLYGFGSAEIGGKLYRLYANGADGNIKTNHDLTSIGIGETNQFDIYFFGFITIGGVNDNE